MKNSLSLRFISPLSITYAINYTITYTIHYKIERRTGLNKPPAYMKEEEEEEDIQFIIPLHTTPAQNHVICIKSLQLY